MTRVSQVKLERDNARPAESAVKSFELLAILKSVYKGRNRMSRTHPESVA
jgi:hypothetical protein